MGALESNTTLIYGIHVRESANDGSDFSNAAADYRVLFLGEDGLLHVKDSSGTVTNPFSGVGSLATDTLWAAAGDLVVATGNDAAARLAIGATNGMVVQRVSGAVAWALPSGYEFDYVEITSAATATATTEATANSLITGNAVTYDGSTRVKIEAWFSHVAVPSSAGSLRNANSVLYDGSSSIGLWNLTSMDIARVARSTPVYMVRYLTPSAASHTYSVRGYVDSGTGTWNAGAGGSGNSMPAWMRITKA